MNFEIKNCQNCKTNFEIVGEDFEFYDKIKVPPPTFCPECRMKRRFMWRNERFLYKRKSDFSGQMIFSGIFPQSPVKIYERDIWVSDK
ncbi:hypothetical protein COV23_01440 [Candidatus Wolfebacteria bacterium CG10_big_fil_rev_8_21_14_0_10_31_9]|uniref:Zinc-binding domain-containing protein n=1 Tax=Candidatus Wolfebacteria bacterium CG10_big_fil_rev_8_21_14_0_10_31_9 TaxID=1975070 RepID=A0A2H0RC64_9BACT|nr:MAG: hypothetical protein COV23_01440 [Candidatus Wolfebacteria bacterium CG10_big_fil_rev_8_21_14_0_10_31_9]